MRRLSSLLFGSIRQLNYRKEMTSRRFLFPESIMAVEKAIYQQNSSLLNFQLRGNTTFLLNQHYVHFSSLCTKKETENENQLQVEIISKEFIKPTIPTPQHLRMHELSLFDQLFPNIYLSFVYFYPNNDNQNSTLKKRQILKQSLSKTLTKFYPLAGRLKDRLHIDCNDDGVYYVEAKVYDHLSDFLKHPDNKSMYGLLPFHPDTVQSLPGKHLAMVQVTEFGCGGIAIGMYTEHKIMDGYSIATFLKAWSTTARGSLEEISPSFIPLHPSNPALSEDATLLVVPLFAKSKTATRRFLFTAASLATLKTKVNASRFVAVTGLICKCAIEASKARSKAINSAPDSLTLTVTANLRDKISPPLPPYSMGNIITVTQPIQCKGDENLKVDYIVQRLKESVGEINSEYAEQLSQYWLCNPEATLKMLHMPYADKNAKHMMISSICRGGTYDADFGWGRPIWVGVGNGDSDFPLTDNFALLMDTRCGTGIEVWVTLREEDMDLFEKDSELLAVSSLNPSPLEYVE